MVDYMSLANESSHSLANDLYDRLVSYDSPIGQCHVIVLYDKCKLIVYVILV
jgi:hypothetical protein